MTQNDASSASEHLRILVDTSSSMETMSQSTYHGAAELIETLPADATVCFDTFGTTYVPGPTGTREEALERLRGAPRPAGRTCLYDALGGGLSAELTAHISSAPARRRTLVVVTDGVDTASREHTQATVRALIGRASQAGIEVTFLGANQDAVTQADAIGIPVARALTFDASNVGVTHAMRSVSESMSRRRVGDDDGGFTPLQRQQSMLARS